MERKTIGGINLLSRERETAWSAFEHEGRQGRW